jgi:uncharacterized protein YbbC (DUF1343 family)
MRKFALLLLWMASLSLAIAQTPPGLIAPGAANLDRYLPQLKGKKVALFANQTSMIGEEHLVDVLMKKGVEVSVIFGPEHGFRGTADAGEKVGNYVDEATRIPVISLYGSKRAPAADDLKEIDVMIFDIQDVGVRFYTFISSLEAYMEAAFLNNKNLIVLDRPNPNIHCVDGPVLDTAFRSFVGMQPVPVVYGMTIGEYAKMLVGEGWLKADAMKTYRAALAAGRPLLEVVTCKNYSRASVYELPVKPSPNLPNLASIYWYPSTCFFEGTVLSEGRGTVAPFQLFGHPSLPKDMFAFTPVSMAGANSPKLKDQLCYGWDLRAAPKLIRKKLNHKISLYYLLEAYRLFPEKEKFFILPKSGDAKASFFNKLAGNSILMEQIKSGMDEAAIRKTWEPGLMKFKKIRAKYLLYK